MSGHLIPSIEAGSPADPLIVFLHGGPLSSRMWSPQIERLQDDFYILAPDLPGHGQNQAEPFSIDRSAQQVAELIRAKSPSGKAVLVGLSLGGAVTLELLRSAPGVVERAMVSGTAAKLGKLLGKLSLAMVGLAGRIPPQKQAEMTFHQLSIPLEMRDLVWDDFTAGATPEYTRAVTQALIDMELPETVTCPLLVAVGEKETAPARQAARKLLSLYPSACGVIAPGLKHVWNLQDPVLFTETVRAWATGANLPEGLLK